MDHINMDAIVKFNAQTTGRDKLFRLCQYTARMVWSLLEGQYVSKESINKMKNLETNLSMTRKLLRLGRCLDVMYSSLQTIHLPDPTIRISITFSRIANSLYLFCDHILWLGRVGLLKVDKDAWSKWSDKCWLYSIIMNLVRDVYEITRLIRISGTHNASYTHKQYLGLDSRVDYISSQAHSHSNVQSFPSYKTIIEWLIRHKHVSADTLKNLCDFWIPYSSLGHAKLSPTTIGFLGSISSFISILQIVDYSYRLSPS